VLILRTRSMDQDRSATTSRSLLRQLAVVQPSADSEEVGVDPVAKIHEAAFTQPRSDHVHNPRRYHVITSAQGFANHWQARIHYYWWKKQRDACLLQEVCDMGGFTRLLHSGEADDLMDEIPTVVVDPLPKSAFGKSDTSYIVLNRPYAFMEWLKKASIPEHYLVMCEGDHLFLRPMPNMMAGQAPGAALFTYINPLNYPEIVRSLIGPVSDVELATVPRIGNSPTFISVKDMRVLAPLWYNTTMQIFQDDTAHKAWNWVLEMYGFSLATFRAGLQKGLVTHENMLAHPPFDTKEVDYKGDPFYLVHLTYPLRYNSTGGFTEDVNSTLWLFDKRAYNDETGPPPRNLPAPPAVVKNDLAHLIIKMINEATENIPCWDVYVANRTITTACAPSSSTQQSNTA